MPGPADDALVALKLKPFYEAEAKRRMEQGRPKEGVEKIPQDKSKSRDAAGAAVGAKAEAVL